MYGRGTLGQARVLGAKEGPEMGGVEGVWGEGVGTAVDLELEFWLKLDLIDFLISRGCGF